MSDVIKLRAEDGSDVEFVNTDEPMSGAMKDVYFSPDHSYVVAFYKQPLDWKAKERVSKIVGEYRKKIFNGPEGEYWKKLFCWPTKIVKYNEKTGIVCPAYDKTFFFKDGKFKGKEKEGKWFASAKLFNKFLTEKERGDWFHRLRMCLEIARAVRRLHMAGLCHSDLSYKNVLVDPETGRASVIDCDGLVVPGKFPPDVLGTPDFIAPEVNETKNEKNAAKRVMPSKQTDLHALAVLIYMYLLNRHPLRGGKVFDKDPDIDEQLMMGAQAVFVENPNDKSNAPKTKSLEKSELPQGDVVKRPFTLCGPFLERLITKAFIDGLHNPKMRPSAQEWEDALIKTVDLFVPCENSKCSEKWFVFGNNKRSVCPFCGTPYTKELPVIDFYYSPKNDGHYQAQNYRLMVYDKQNIYRWHVNYLVSPNEKLANEDKTPVADFQIFHGKWVLINRRLPSLYVIGTDKTRKQIPVNQYVELTDGINLLLSTEEGGRLAHVTLTNKR